MHTVTAQDLHELVAIEGDHCVSIYLPTYPVSREGQQDSVRLGNLVAAAEQQLIDEGMTEKDARELLEPISDLPRQSDWKERKAGLAIFRSKSQLTYFQLATPFQEGSHTGERFYIRPLLPTIGTNTRFFILAISRNEVRLLKATSRGHERLALPGLSASMEEGLNLQTADRGEQVHSAMRGDLGKEAGVFHGQGGHRDTIKDELSEYCGLIDESLGPMFQQTDWPLILAGVDYEIAIFRKAFNYPHIADETLHGTFDHIKDWEVYERALPIAQRYFGIKRQQALTKYRTLSDRMLTSDDLEEILQAAHEGKIDTLFVDCSSEIFGRFDSEKKSVEFVEERNPDFDLIELAVTQTGRHRGTVYSVKRDELPAGVSMGALFRYR